MSESFTDRPELLDVLRAGPVGLSSHDEAERARADMLPWLEEHVAELPQARQHSLQRQRFRRRAAWAGALAAAVAAVSLVVFVQDGQVLESRAPVARKSPAKTDFATVVSGSGTSSSRAVTEGEKLELDGLVETSEGETVALQAGRGYQVELGPSTSLSFESPVASNTSWGSKSRGEAGGDYRDIRLRLNEGLAKLSVLPLPQGSTLTVVTADALVTVIGTAFSVQAQEGKPTCVRVSEGQVSVKRETEERSLGAGQTWGCEDEVETDQGAVLDEPTAKKAPRGQTTTLPQENALLSRALAAESRGDVERARRAYRKLLAQYPRSSFSQDARAGLRRLNQPNK